MREKKREREREGGGEGKVQVKTVIIIIAATIGKVLWFLVIPFDPIGQDSKIKKGLNH